MDLEMMVNGLLLFSGCTRSDTFLEERPNIIHCHDWQTGLIPVQLKANYEQQSVLSGIKNCVYHS